jgi:hypothetical protein
MNTLIGAIVAGVISFATTTIALLTQSGVDEFGDISAVSWTVAFLGSLVSVLKDNQALWTRDVISRVTKHPVVIPDKYLPEQSQ